MSINGNGKCQHLGAERTRRESVLAERSEKSRLACRFHPWKNTTWARACPISTFSTATQNYTHLAQQQPQPSCFCNVASFVDSLSYSYVSLSPVPLLSAPTTTATATATTAPPPFIAPLDLSPSSTSTSTPKTTSLSYLADPSWPRRTKNELAGQQQRERLRRRFQRNGPLATENKGWQ